MNALRDVSIESTEFAVRPDGEGFSTYEGDGADVDNYALLWLIEP